MAPNTETETVFVAVFFGSVDTFSEAITGAVGYGKSPSENPLFLCGAPKGFVGQVAS